MDERGLKVGGYARFTSTDYPGELAAVVFVQGCPWRCSYCHNPHLQPRGSEPLMRWKDLLTFLASRAGLLDAVVFSGGEPTLDPALEDAMRDVKALGFKIGLHTAGIYPQRLQQVLPLVDWVGLDVKTSFDAYDELTGAPGSAQAAPAPAARSRSPSMSASAAQPSHWPCRPRCRSRRAAANRRTSRMFHAACRRDPSSTGGS